MNITLWVFQALLALLFVSGGAYKTAKPEMLAKQTRALSPVVWRALGMIELVGAVLLVVPTLLNTMPELMPLAAAMLAVESLFLVALYARRSVKLVAENPFTWAAAMALMTVFVAWGRYALSPIA